MIGQNLNAKNVVNSSWTVDEKEHKTNQELRISRMQTYKLLIKSPQILFWILHILIREWSPVMGMLKENIEHITIKMKHKNVCILCYWIEEMVYKMHEEQKVVSECHTSRSR